MGNWNDVLALVEAQLKAKGISPAAASRIATGHPYLVYSLRKGVNPTYDTLKALCDALGLEFYVGPPRNAGDPAWSSTIEKMTEALGLPAATGVDEVIEKIKSLNRWDPAALKAYMEEAEVALQKWQSEAMDAVVEILKQMKAAGPGTSVAQAAQAVQGSEDRDRRGGDPTCPRTRKTSEALAAPGSGRSPRISRRAGRRGARAGPHSALQPRIPHTPEAQGQKRGRRGRLRR